MNAADVKRAIIYAIEKHGDQTDKAGAPYFLHILRVSAAGKTPEEQIVGALHDTVEDTEATLVEIKCMFGDDIREAVSAMTHCGIGTYADYITELAQNPLARAVKINDLKDNLLRLHLLTPDVARGLRKRYGSALKYLEAQ